METLSTLFDNANNVGLIPPMIVSTAYWVSIQLFQPTPEQVKEAQLKRKAAGPTKSSSFEPTLLNLFIFAHNLLLCVFSVLCFVNTLPILLSLVSERGVYGGLCGIKDAYTQTSWGYWSYLFYLSKYYEVIDTYIVILKGRRPINLQVYHHIGAMIGCGWFHQEQAIGSFIFMVPNSFVHSIMYLYYALSVVKIRVPFKSIITTIQMVQFLFGHCCLIYTTLALYPECITDNERAINAYHFVYISWLFFMFRRFYNQTYKKKNEKKIN